MLGNEMANQSQEEVQTQVQTEQTQEEPVTTQEEEYIEVKYNHEPIKIKKDEAPTYIQKGLNYDKVSQKVQEYEQHLKELAELSGYQSPDELIQAMNEAKQQQERQKYLDKGIDPDAVNELLNNHPDVQYARQMRQQLEEERKFQQEANELFSEFPDLKPDNIQPEVWQLRQQKGLSLLDAYLRVNFKSLAQQKEQEAIQKISNNQATSTGSLSQGAVNHQTSISKMSKEDFQALQERVLRGERVQL